MKRDAKEPELRPPTSEIMMTSHEVADYVNCDPSTVFRLVKTEGLPAFRVARRWRFLRADIEEWIAQHHVRPTRIEPSSPSRYKRKS